MPTAFRCGLDGKLLVDPMRTPQGYVFERSGLQRYLYANGRCPVTGHPLQLEQCMRDGSLRREILLWVRQAQKRGRAREDFLREVVTNE